MLCDNLAFYDPEFHCTMLMSYCIKLYVVHIPVVRAEHIHMVGASPRQG